VASGAAVANRQPSAGFGQDQTFGSDFTCNAPVSLRYKVEGYAQTRDAYPSVRGELKDAERIAQCEASLGKLAAAYELFKTGDVRGIELRLSPNIRDIAAQRAVRSTANWRSD